MRATRIICGVVIAVSVSLTFPAPTRAQPITDEQVSAAIAGMKRHLYRFQDEKTGGWPIDKFAGSNKYGGGTALVTLALLIAGEPAQHPRLARAIDHLREIDTRGTYPIAVRTHVWAQLPGPYLPLLETDATWLLGAADERGRYRYVPHPTTFDNSATQYALLGLWEATKRGVDVPDLAMLKARRHFLDTQLHDGGWTYSDIGRSYGSMTAAGVTCLLIVQGQLFAEQVAPDPDTAAAIDRGLAWFDANFDGPDNPLNPDHYPLAYLYGMERMALAGGYRYFNRQDWYDAGARFILAHQDRDETSPFVGSIRFRDRELSTAFALMFLARGQYPVWATKLKVPAVRWNNRPNDLASLTAYLSDMREQEYNWQVVSVEEPAERWGNAPLLYLACEDEVNLTDAQQRELRKYLDGGGMLLCNPDNGSGKMIRSVRQLAKQLYPDRPMRRLPDEHPFFNALVPMEARGGQVIEAVGNGARELIVLPIRDWGYAYQADRNPGAGSTWDATINVWAVATNRGLVPNRLVPRHPVRIEHAVTGRVTVGRASYDGNWLAEPTAWTPVATVLHNRTGVQLTTSDVPLDQLNQLDARTVPLVHLTGIDAIKLSPAHRAAIGEYVLAGGTILAETVGGRGAFGSSVEDQLGELFGQGAVTLTDNDAIVRGDRLEGGFDCRDVTYRRYAVAELRLGRRLRLAAFHFDGRPAVIVSRQDLSTAMVGVNQWGIVGYKPDWARKLAVNIVLAARHSVKGEN